MVSRTDRKMKIIQVPRRFVAAEWGGTETAVLATSRALVNLGHEVEIYTSLALTRSRKDVIGGITVRRFRYVYPFFGLSAAAKEAMDKKAGNMLSFHLFYNLLKAPDVSLFVAHTGKRIGGIVRTVARLRRRPYVVFLHGGYFDIPPMAEANLLEPIKGLVEWGRIFGALLGSRQVLKDAAAIFCVGRNEFDIAAARFPEKQVIYLPNGVDCKAFASGDAAMFCRHYGMDPSRKIVLNIGRIDPQKNQLDLLEAFAALRQEERDIHLVMIGPITGKDYHRHLEDRIDALDMQDRVTLVPGLEQGSPLLPGALHAASLFCLPSLHEPFGIAILEAWAAGVPVIAGNIGGIPSFVENGIDGVLVEPGNVPALNKAMAAILDDASLAADLAANGRAKAASAYDWAELASRLERHYQEILAGWR